MYYNLNGFISLLQSGGIFSMKKSVAVSVFLGTLLLISTILLVTLGSTKHADLKGPLRQKLQTFMDKKAREIQFNGTVLVAENGNVIFQKGYGYADYDLKTPNQINTEYRIASLTKSFTAVSILQLEAQGKLKTSDPIAKYFPSFKNGKKITIHDLLTHSSGVKSHYTMTDTTKPITLAAFIDLMSKQNLSFAPGSQYKYSDTGYMILAGIVEKVSGEKYQEYYRDHIFRIAGMNHTYFSSEDTDKMATGYQNMQKAVMTDDESQLAGAGNIISTVGDMLKYNNAFHKNLLLPQAEEEKMETGYINSAPWGAFKYGYGWNVADNFLSFGRPMIEHNGNLIGFKSEVVDFVDDRLFVLVLSNNNGKWNSGALSRELASICFEKRYWFYQENY